jgi:hypothetical protein
MKANSGEFFYCVYGRAIRRAVLVVLAFLAGVWSLSAGAAPVNPWQGTWNTTYGTMVIRANGTGTYTHDNGQLEDVTWNASTLKGIWTETPTRKPPNDLGKFVFTLDVSGDSFTGKWNYADKPPTLTGWDGTCVKGICKKTRIDATWKVQLEGPPRDRNGNIYPNIATAKLLGAGRLISLGKVEGDTIGDARGVAALRLVLFVGSDKRLNLRAILDGEYNERRSKEKSVSLEVVVERGIKNDCPKGALGRLSLVDRKSKVDSAILSLCDRIFYWRNAKSWDNTVIVRIEKVAVIPKK